MAFVGMGLTALGLSVIRMSIPGGASSFALDANNDGAATIAVAHKTGTIDRIAVTWGTVTGTPPTYIVGIEGTTNTRVPDGTYKGGGSPASVTAVATASTTVIYTLSNSIAVTAGDSLAVTVRYSSGTVNASNFANVVYGFPQIPTVNMPFPALLTAGTWTATVATHPAITPIYTDESIPPGCMPAQSVNTDEQGTGGSNWPAIKFTSPLPVRLVGLELYARITGGDSADWKVAVYSGTNTTAVSVTTLDQSQVVGSNGEGLMTIPLPAYDTSAGEVIRILPVGTTANAIRLYQMVFLNSAMRARFSPLLSRSTTSSLATVSWTDTDTILLNAAPIISAVDSGSAGSGGGPLVGGRLVG